MGLGLHHACSRRHARGARAPGRPGPVVRPGLHRHSRAGSRRVPHLPRAGTARAPDRRARGARGPRHAVRRGGTRRHDERRPRPARSFVAAELGGLSVQGRREDEERSAVLAVLDAQGGLAAAAERLGIHRNTVLQRLRRAEERRGSPATSRVAELHAALRPVEVLGPVVLAAEPARP
ncbi:helix-turn-helix domain-containing protein [Nocardioides sp. B-3]|uniref:helix-turn-helix domain-containing protein n=1 Tax=Nocardioides sp. B-3 TaxID=2895565 RepID=UPI003FA56883